jgi:thymidine kinase
MREFAKARELFKDVIDTSYYFDSISAEIVRFKIENAIKDRSVPLIFLIGDPGVGKSYMLKYISKEVEKEHLSIFIDHPFFDKRDLLKILYEKKGLFFDASQSFNLLKDRIVNVYKNVVHTIFLDEAQLLNEEQLELIRILSDTKVFQFVLSMHKEEGKTILEKKHFKSRNKLVIHYENIQSEEVHRYIQSTLMKEGFSEISLMFSKKHSRIINRYCEGNFRTIKKFVYSVLDILEYAKVNGIKRHYDINGCLLKMSALNIGAIQ